MVLNEEISPNASKVARYDWSRVFQADLDNRKMTENLRQTFKNSGIALPENVNISIEGKGSKWLVVNRENRKVYHIRKKADILSISAPIPTQLEKAVNFTTRRNLVAQRIGEKNEFLKNLAFNSLQDKTIQNDGSSRYGLYDFVDEFDRRALMYNLNRELARCALIVNSLLSLFPKPFHNTVSMSRRVCVFWMAKCSQVVCAASELV